jgi:hypothetical protein
VKAEVTFDIDLLKTQKFISSSNEKFLNLFFKEEMDFNKYVSRVIVQDIQSFKMESLKEWEFQILTRINQNI